MIISMAARGGAVLAGNIDPANDGSQYAFGENIGWLNLKPVGGQGVTVGDAGLTGYIWGENIGWINLSCLNADTCATVIYGVTNDGTGRLSGYAWGENAGWINFAPAGGGVFINACGEFSGTAWGESIGWISFRSDGAAPFKLKTSWVSALDTVPPATIITSSLKDWYNTDTHVMLSATDCGKGVQDVHYALNGGGDVITPGPTATANVTTEGCTTMTYFSVDQAGNIESSKLTTVCIDKTPPVVTIASPVNNQTYYINSVLPANYSITDSGSGVAATTATAPNGSTINTSTAGSYTFSVTAIDKAGNQSSPVNTYTIAYPGNMDPNSANCQYAWAENVGWINFKPIWGPGVTVTGSAVTGMAWGENIGWINLSCLNADTCATVIYGVMNDGKGKLSGYAWGENVGWINFNPANGGVSIGSDGKFNGHAWGENTGWINFSAANSCVKTAWVSQADTTPPVISGTPSNMVTEAASASGAVVTYSLPTAADAMDGVVEVTCAPASGSAFSIGSTTVTCSSSDKSNNTATSGFTVTVRDTTPPVITAHADVTALATSSSAVVNYDLPAATDLVDGAVPVSCVPAPGSTFSVGATAVNCSAADAHGNTAQSAFNVMQSYNWTGFFQPVDNAPVFNAVKAGKPVPLKFSLSGYQGLDIMSQGSPGSAPIPCDSAAAVVDDLTDTVTAGASGLTYDAITDQYIYVWKTARGWAGTCRQLRVSLKDGSVHVVNFKFTK